MTTVFSREEKKDTIRVHLLHRNATEIADANHLKENVNHVKNKSKEQAITACSYLLVMLL